MLQFYNFKVQMNLQLLRIGQKLSNVIFTTVKKIVIDTESSNSRQRHLVQALQIQMPTGAKQVSEMHEVAELVLGNLDNTEAI